MNNKKGLLIYDKASAIRNKWFINKLIEEGIEYDLDINLQIYTKGDNIAEWILPDFVICRAVDNDIHSFYSKMGIRVFNNAYTALIANDKWETYRLATELGIPVMPTIHNATNNNISYPAVIKSVDGHGGNEVFLIYSASELDIALQKITGEYIVQPLCSEPGIDMRVYAMGGEIIAAVLRTSDRDFRSNYSLGGNAQLTECTVSQRDIISLICDKLHPDFVGIDFIRHNGKWILNEIEDAVGCRMLYSLTDINAAKLYIEYISAELKK